MQSRSKGSLVVVTRLIFLLASTWLFCALMPVRHAHADDQYRGGIDIDTSEMQNLNYLMRKTLRTMRTLELDRVEDACNDKSRNPRSFKANRCFQKYLQIYKNPIVDMRVIFGYKNNDFTGGAEDTAMRDALIDRILAQCPPQWANVFACGFKRDPDDAEVFYKEITNPQGVRRLVKLTIAQSSYTWSDQENRGKYQKSQIERTAHARELFLDGLKKADVVLYNGHSRDGGGPDFGPPVLNKKGHTDYRWYRSHPKGLQAMVQSLKSAGKHTASVIGLISCSSQQHFYKYLKPLAPQSGFLLTRGISWWSDEPATLIGALNGLLGQICEPGLTKEMNLNRRMDPSSRLYPIHLF
jgi:hypothetical protein